MISRKHVKIVCSVNSSPFPVKLKWKCNYITHKRGADLKIILAPALGGFSWRCPGMLMRSTSFRRGGLLFGVISHYLNWQLIFHACFSRLYIWAFLSSKPPRDLGSRLGSANRSVTLSNSFYLPMLELLQLWNKKILFFALKDIFQL